MNLLLANEAGREILWNVSHPANAILMYALLVLALLVAAVGVLRRVEIWLSGTGPLAPSMPWWVRLSDLINFALFQKGVNRERRAALSHSLVYVGFLVLLFTTTMVFIDNDLGLRIYRGDFYLAVTVLSDLFGLGFLVGLLLMACRRYQSSGNFLHNRGADLILLVSLCLLVVQGYLIEGLRIQITKDPWGWYSPVGMLVAQFFWGLPESSARWLHFATWWFHTITVMLCLALAPYSKFFHIIASPLNLFLKSRERPAGALPFPGDIMARLEAGEEFTLGLGSIKDYSPKQLLDLDACTSCGRCQDACPAYQSGKPLSPKWLILDTRNHALALHATHGLQGPSVLPTPLKQLDQALVEKLFLPSSGLKPIAETKVDAGWQYQNQGAFRGENPLVQKSARVLGSSVEQTICGDVLDPDVFWSCNTCLACVEACPVGIQHVDQIVENRRHQVMVAGKLPEEAARTLKSIENRSNPYGAPEDRSKWVGDLPLKILQPGDEVDYLYWVGCVSSFDSRKQKIARALVTLMQRANLSFGILGNAEGCCGDPARRLGDENLFQILAKQNIELLRTIRFKTLVANCPHCFNTIKNEYPQLGNLGEGREPEIIHHSVLLQRLLSQRRLPIPTTKDSKAWTFHDPCYLGRYNGEFKAPRVTLKSSTALRVLEMEKSREKAMCCGAGGGHFWFDMKVGTRVNVTRAEQALQTGADAVATACPFCMHMLEDGAKLTSSNEGSLEVRDIAEVLLEQIDASSAAANAEKP